MSHSNLEAQIYIPLSSQEFMWPQQPGQFLSVKDGKGLESPNQFIPPAAQVVPLQDNPSGFYVSKTSGSEVSSILAFYTGKNSFLFDLLVCSLRLSSDQSHYFFPMSRKDYRTSVLLIQEKQMSLYYNEFSEAISTFMLKDSTLLVCGCVVCFVFFFFKENCIQLRRSLRKAFDLHWR